MNTLMFYPKNIRKNYVKNINTSGITTPPEQYNRNVLFVSFLVTLAVSTLFFFIDISLLFAPLVFIFVNLFFYFKVGLQAHDKIRQMEKVFPDFISLMASNLRAGITVDRAFVMSARKEFAPLDKEILETGKEIATGRNIIFALQEMSKRIESEKIEKIIMLIISGLKAGGNISDLLGETARNMKEREVIEKKAVSTILMYVIFIFFAVSVGAPVLFALSSVLVEVIINLTANIPETSASQAMPLTFSQIPITVEFVVYFSLAFIFVTNLISCFVVGLVNKGEGRTGLKYFIPLIIVSLTIFFTIRTVLSKILLSIIVT